MDFNSLLIWMVCLSCIALMLRATQLPWRETGGWIVISVLLLLITVIVAMSVPGWAGWIGGILWLGFVFIPLITLKQINQLVYQEQYQQAGQLARWIRWLHPADGWWEQPQLFKALELVQTGDLEKAQTILAYYQTVKNSTGRVAIILGYRILANWSGLLTWCEENLPTALVANESILMISYLRALAETGNLNRLLEEFKKLQPAFEKSNNLISLNFGRLYILAFCGEVATLQKLLDHHLNLKSETSRQFWLATAEIYQGNDHLGEEKLQALRHSPDIALQNAIDWRLQQPCIHPQQILTPTSWQILVQIKDQIRQEERYSSVIARGKTAYATWGLIAINAVIFCLAVVGGGSQNPQTLYRLGALVPEVAWGGEWWRLLSATFLHLGGLHLTMNLTGLYVLGRLVEFSLGIPRYLLAYFACGVGSMFIITLMAYLFPSEPQFVVGASGAIMGMMGVLAAILLKAWFKEKAPVAAQGLRVIFMLISVQIIFDLITPQVSFLGHASGALLGLLVGSLLIWKQ